MDDDIRPWLKGFVDSVGHEKAKLLLAGAGNFVHLSQTNNTLAERIIEMANFLLVSEGGILLRLSIVLIAYLIKVYQMY